jgi:hypothetical protein
MHFIAKLLSFDLSGSTEQDYVACVRAIKPEMRQEMTLPGNSPARGIVPYRVRANSFLGQGWHFLSCQLNVPFHQSIKIEPRIASP